MQTNKGNKPSGVTKRFNIPRRLEEVRENLDSASKFLSRARAITPEAFVASDGIVLVRASGLNGGSHIIIMDTDKNVVWMSDSMDALSLLPSGANAIGSKCHAVFGRNCNFNECPVDIAIKNKSSFIDDVEGPAGEIHTVCAIAIVDSNGDFSGAIEIIQKKARNV